MYVFKYYQIQNGILKKATKSRNDKMSNVLYWFNK